MDLRVTGEATRDLLQLGADLIGFVSVSLFIPREHLAKSAHTTCLSPLIHIEVLHKDYSFYRSFNVPRGTFSIDRLT
jgi:hypothetical protein